MVENEFELLLLFVFCVLDVIRQRDHLSFKPPPNFQGILKDCWKWNLTLQTLHFAKKIKFFRKFDTCVAKLSVKFQELCDEWIHT